MKRYQLFLIASLILFSQTTFSQITSNGTFFSFEAAQENPKEVRVLKLSSSTIDKFTEPEFNVAFPRLKVLKLDGIKDIELQKLLMSIEGSKELEEIYISECDLNYLPHQIGNFTNLKILDISNNNLRTLPYEVEFLTNLKSVDVSDNNLVSLNNKIINWSNLTHFNIANNDSLKQDKVFLTISFLTSLKTLTIGGSTNLKPSLGDVQNIEHLRIIESNFNSLPNEAIVLNNLNELTIVDTDAKELLNLFTANEIEVLSISGSSFNGGINQFKSLRELNVNNCRIPASFYELDRGEKLSTITLNDCSDFKMDEFCNHFQNNKTVKNLSITSCGITEIPANITNLKELERLVLRRNNIERLPLELAQLKDIKVIDIKNNIINPNQIKKVQQLNDQIAFYWDYYDEFIVDKENSPVLAKKEIVQPIEGVDVPKQDFRITTQEETTLSFESGTSIEIPKKAFVDANGNLVEGEVDITFREFIDPVDFLVSGIPMGYDSAGVTYNFSSAGQIEFKASQNGQEVFPNPNNLIEVSMMSNNNDPAMNMYVFDEDKGNWEMMGGNKISDPNDTLLLSEMNGMIEFQQNLRLAQYQPPPIYYDLLNFSVHKENKLKTFKINLSSLPTTSTTRDARKSYEELKVLRKYSWIYDGDNVAGAMSKLDSISDFIKKSYKKFRVRQLSFSSNRTFQKDSPNFINKIDVCANPNDDNYLLTISMFNDTLVIPVYPEIISRYPEMVQRRNKQFYKSYNKAVKRNEKNWKRADKRYEKILAEYENNFASINRYTERNRKSLETEAMVNRTFNLLSFGVYNCDQIRRLKQPKRLIVKLMDEKNNEIQPFTTFVIDKSTNSVIRYNGNGKVSYDAASKNSLFLVLKDDKIGVVDSETFSKAMKNRDKEIRIKTFSNKEISIGELKSYL